MNKKLVSDRDFWAAKNLENAAEFLKRGWHNCALFLINEISDAYKKIPPAQKGFHHEHCNE